MTPQERIKADALYHTKYAQPKPKTLTECKYTSYIAGATAVNDRAQLLVDALEEIERRIKVGKAGASYQIEMIRPVVMKALEQWKSGKGKDEPKEECTCSLTRIVTHGKCYKCPELTNPQQSK